MKKFMKALALILTVAILATIPAIAEMFTDAETAMETLLGTDIAQAGETLGLAKTQTEGVDEAYLTLYESEDLLLGGLNGSVVSISVFSGSYGIYGVQLGESVADAEAALTARGLVHAVNNDTETGVTTLEITDPDREDIRGYFDIDGGKVIGLYIFIDVDPAEEVVAEEVVAEEPVATAVPSKATAPVKASGYIQLTGDAHLRKSPDKESSSLTVLSKGTKLKYTATAKDSRGVTWYKVKSGKKTGWISSKVSKKIKKSAYNSGSSSEKKESGYIELTGKCHVRKSPDKESKSLDVFGKGAVLKYTATAKDSRGVKWYKVSADGVTGWISSKNAKKK